MTPAKADALIQEFIDLGEQMKRLKDRGQSFPLDTAAYVAMRVLRHPDALPAGDLALRKGVARDGDEPPPARAVEDALEACRPYRAYAAMRIWASAGERT